MKVISLGMGVQSTALYYMSSTGELPRADVAIFADTGAERKESLEYYLFLKKWMRKNKGIPIYVANYYDIESDILESKNSTGQRFVTIPAFTLSGGQMRRQCTNEYKIKQVNKKIREICGLQHRQRYPEVELWFGISLDEITRIAVPWDKWKTNVYPFVGYSINYNSETIKISDMRLSRNNIYNWFKQNNLPIPSKSACYFCPYQNRHQWNTLCNDDFNKAIKIDDHIRDQSTRGIKEKLYLHRLLKPVSDIDFSDSQISLFDSDDECSGNCMI